MANRSRNRPEGGDPDITHSRLPVLRADKHFVDRPVVDIITVTKSDEAPDIREAKFTSIRFEAGRAAKRTIRGSRKKP